MFSDINISQGSVATPLRCGGICNDLFIADFLLIVTVTEVKLEKAAQGVAQCEVSAYARCCRRCVATFWKEQTRRSQNCKYLP